MADLRGYERRPPPPHRIQIHGVFGENLAKSYIGAPSPGGLAPSPRGNPGSATDNYLIDLIRIYKYPVADPEFPRGSPRI